MRVNLITSQLIDTYIIKERRHCLNQWWILAFSNLLLELNTSFSLSDDLFNHLLSESILVELFLFRFLILMSSLWDSASHLKLSHVSLEFLNYLSNLLRTQPQSFRYLSSFHLFHIVHIKGFILLSKLLHLSLWNLLIILPKPSF